MGTTRREVLGLAGKSAAALAAGSFVACGDDRPPQFIDLSDPAVRARRDVVRLEHWPPGEAGQALLTFGVSRGEAVDVEFSTANRRTVLSQTGRGARSDTVRLRLAPGDPGVLWLTAIAVGEPERPGDWLVVRGPGWTMRIEVWIEPVHGQWVGGGRNGAPLDLGMVAVHSALMRVGTEAHVVAFSPPRHRNPNGGFMADPGRGDQHRWNLAGLRDVEIAMCELSGYRVSEQRMPDTRETPRWNLFCAGHAHLPDGRLLVAGGHAGILGDNARHLHVYDPVEQSWRRVPGAELRTARWYPTVTALPDGRMLITTGSSAALAEGPFNDPTGEDRPKYYLAELAEEFVENQYWDNIQNDYEIFDPAAMKLVSADRDDLVDESVLGTTDDQKGRRHKDRVATYPAVFVLPRGTAVADDVVVIVETNRAWLSRYRPGEARALARERRHYTMSTRGSRSYPHFGAFVLLPFEAGGNRFRILALGGQHETTANRRDFLVMRPATATAEIFDYDASKALGDQRGWRPVKPMAARRILCDATLLADGRVLVTGGATSGWANRNDGKVYDAEIFDPVDESFRPAARARFDRRYHSTALLLPDGSVLKAGSHGGFAENPTTIEAHVLAERYLPPYLWRGPRPRILSITGRTAIRPGTRFIVTADGHALDGTAKVVLVRLGSVTHGFDMDQRYVRLRATSEPMTTPGWRRFTVEAPERPADAPPGDYMLFVVDRFGVPSTGRFMRVEAAPPGGR